MKILLVIPKYKLTNKKYYEYLFPLGLGYLSSVMKKAGHDVDCLNLNHHEGTIENILNNVLNSKKYGIVCSGHIGVGYAVIEKIINTTHEHKSKPLFILGGAIITSAPKLIFNALKPDYAVLGEGEVTIIELLNAIEKKKDLNKVDGIMFKNKNELIITKPRKVIENLDELPYPDLEGLGFSEKLENTSWASFLEILDYPRDYSILCSRGCPFQCTFCYHCLGIKYRTRSIENIMKELRQAIKKYNINVISIHDDLFSVNKERLYEFCRKIKALFKELNQECKWSCQLSVHNVDKEMLEILKDSGCFSVSYGFESYSPIVLKSMKKPITPEQIDRAIKLTMDAKIGIQGGFIFGDRAETKETAKETLNYWKKNCKGQLGLGFIQPYPGSEIYNHCVKKGIIKDEVDFIKNYISHPNWLNMTDTMSDEDILELRQEIIKTRIKYLKYVTPKKIVKKKFFNIFVTCPFCNENLIYYNCYLKNRYFFVYATTCKKCNMLFSIASPLYKFTLKNYNQLEFLRKKYLFLRDNFLKKRL
jgi:anaerobic magnesium-protoporphyrin IX monomethyl ester cyclase